MTQTAELTSNLEMASPAEPAAVPALEVRDLRKEFIRRDGGRRPEPDEVAVPPDRTAQDGHGR